MFVECDMTTDTPKAGKGRLFKSVSAAVLVFFGAQLCLSSPLAALTVEEAAGKREKTRAPSNYEEFRNRASERRSEQPSQQERDPRLACLLSLIIPGGGHVYLRKDLKAVSFFALTGALYATSGYFFYRALFAGASGPEMKSRLLVAGLMLAISAAVHAIGVVEAYNDAVEINETKFYYGRERSPSPYVARMERTGK